MNNIEHCPEHLFDWIRQKSYHSLNAQQRQEADRFFSPGEYDDLHAAARAVKETVSEETNRKTRIRQNVMNRFDERYGTKAGHKTIALGAVFWKAAAVALAIGMPLSAYWLIKASNNSLGARLSEKADTVYIEKTMAGDPVKVYDTVYIVKEERPVQRRERDRTHVEVARAYEAGDAVLPSERPGQPIEKLDAVPNKPKRNAIKDDSLLNHYGFVTL